MTSHVFDNFFFIVKYHFFSFFLVNSLFWELFCQYFLKTVGHSESTSINFTSNLIFFFRLTENVQNYELITLSCVDHVYEKCSYETGISKTSLLRRLCADPSQCNFTIRPKSTYSSKRHDFETNSMTQISFEI